MDNDNSSNSSGHDSDTTNPERFDDDYIEEQTVCVCLKPVSNLSRIGSWLRSHNF